MQKKYVFKMMALIAAALIVLYAGCNTDDEARLAVRVSAAPASIPVNGTSTITAEVTNFEGSPISGVSIEWGTSFGSLQSGNGVTNSLGRATATLTGQGAAGTATVTATTLLTREQGQTTVRIGLD